MVWPRRRAPTPTIAKRDIKTVAALAAMDVALAGLRLAIERVQDEARSDERERTRE